MSLLQPPLCQDGFRKVAKADQGALSKVQLNEPIEFWHPNFRKDHPELLCLVQRRVSEHTMSVMWLYTNMYMYMYMPLYMYVHACMQNVVSYSIHVCRASIFNQPWLPYESQI